MGPFLTLQLGRWADTCHTQPAVDVTLFTGYWRTRFPVKRTWGRACRPHIRHAPTSDLRALPTQFQDG